MSGSPRRAFFVKIFLPGGDPDGLKIVEKSNWTGSGLVFPRPLFGEARTATNSSGPAFTCSKGHPKRASCPAYTSAKPTRFVRGSNSTRGRRISGHGQPYSPAKTRT